MPLQRLRRVLEADYRVRIESTNDLVALVNSRVEKRRRVFQAKGEAPPVFKNAGVFSPLQGWRDWNIRAIDLLHKIGFLTTPSWTNMARLSASWATRRYFWAIVEPAGQPSGLRLSNDARRMDFHQKTLLSDEFGIGMAGLLIEQFFSAGSFVDISVALGDPTMYQDIDLEGDTQPDYLMWGDGDNSPYYVVECKGSQSSRNSSYHQLRRGLEQVPSVVFGAGPRQVFTIVVATCMLEDRTEVFVLDPPPDAPDDEGAQNESAERVSERTGKRAWRIHNVEAFQKRAMIAEESNLLKWAGQYQTAAERDRRLEKVRPESIGMPNAPLEIRRSDFGIFRGIEEPLFPALGARKLRIFTGVEEELLHSIIHEHPYKTPEIQLHLPPNVSVSRSGSCMVIEGV